MGLKGSAPMVLNRGTRTPPGREKLEGASMTCHHQSSPDLRSVCFDVTRVTRHLTPYPGRRLRITPATLPSRYPGAHRAVGTELRPRAGGARPRRRGG